MTSTEHVKASTWPRLLGGVVLVIAVAAVFWQFAGDDNPAMQEPPTVTGTPILTATGGVPFEWNVTVSPGEDGQLCGQGSLGQQSQDRTGQPCSVVIGPDAVGNDLFGSGGSSTGPEGQTLVWGLVHPDVVEVVVELSDGREEVATVATGGRSGSAYAISVWVYATDGEVVARTARTADGTEERVETSPTNG